MNALDDKPSTENASRAKTYLEMLQGLSEKNKASIRKVLDCRIDNDPVAFIVFSENVWWKSKEPMPVRTLGRGQDREILWTMAKLYCACDLPHQDGATLIHQLATAVRSNANKALLIRTRIQNILTTSDPTHLEFDLRWALKEVDAPIDWVDLFADILLWNHDVRARWAAHFYKA
jgi:CRISPR type I-E-associated protein CasB/Cse2